MYFNFIFQLNSSHDAENSSKSKNLVVQTDNTRSHIKLVELKQLKLVLDDISKKKQSVKVNGNDQHVHSATKVLHIERLISFYQPQLMYNLKCIVINILHAIFQANDDHEIGTACDPSETSQQSDNELVRIYYIF